MLSSQSVVLIHPAPGRIALSRARRPLHPRTGGLMGHHQASDAAQVEALRDAALAAFGAVHGLCNNAGVGGPHEPIWQVSRSDLDWVFGVNSWGVVNGIRAFVPVLRAGCRPYRQHRLDLRPSPAASVLTVPPSTRSWRSRRRCTSSFGRSTPMSVSRCSAPVRSGRGSPIQIGTGRRRPDRRWTKDPTARRP